MTKYTLPELPYALDALEPFISKEIMDLHYNKHHKAYVDNLNKAIDQYADAEKKAEKENNPSPVIDLQAAVNFNGGGHTNHTLFWENLAPKGKGGGEQPTNSEFIKAVTRDFGSFDKLLEQLTAKLTAHQGSGWVWLALCKTNKTLHIVACDNQDPVSKKGFIPLLGIDVWEHAYYLQYKNVRADYIKNIWNVINWKAVEDRFNKA